MAEIKVLYDDFSLTSKWSCRTVYSYNSTGSFNSATNTPSSVQYAEKTVRFAVSIPSGAKVKGAKVYASYTAGLFGGKMEINGTRLEDGSFVTLENPDLSAGYVDVVFRWTAWTDGSSAHSSSYPTYNGTSSQAVTHNHESPTTVYDIYLLIEYEHSGIIYHAENGVLVPYKLYHAEGGALVPYLLQHAEDGALVPYG